MKRETLQEIHRHLRAIDVAILREIEEMPKIEAKSDDKNIEPKRS